MAKLKVVNPVARAIQHHVDPAPRLRELNGKRIGLYWNLKVGGDVALRQTEGLLKTRYPDAQFAHYHGSVGSSIRHARPGDSDRIASEVDAVIGSSAD